MENVWFAKTYLQRFSVHRWESHSETVGRATHSLPSLAPEASLSEGERKNRQNKNSNKNMKKGTKWRQGQTVENSKNGGEQEGRRRVVKNRLEPLQNLVCSDVAWSSKRLCYHVCVENSFYKRFIPLTSSQRQIFAFLLLVIERHS